MKSFMVCLLFVTLLGGALCVPHRLRRQAPPADVPNGPPEGITTQDSTKINGLDSARVVMLNDVKNQAAMGVPVDPKKIDTMFDKVFIAPPGV